MAKPRMHLTAFVGRLPEEQDEDVLREGIRVLSQALMEGEVAAEIADPLSAANRRGVIHRGLKPGNLTLTKAGAQLLDSGLAKLKGHEDERAAASLASAPTQTRPLTSEGAIVGTLQQVAPGQAVGKPADARAGLWVAEKTDRSEPSATSQGAMRGGRGHLDREVQVTQDARDHLGLVDQRD